MPHITPLTGAVGICVPVAVALCLSDGIPKGARRNFTHASTGYNGPILDTRLSWASSHIVSDMARILLEEKGGYHWAFGSTADSSHDGVLFVAGCPDLNSTCDPLHPTAHMVLEGWDRADTAYNRLPTAARPLALTPHEYTGQLGVFVNEQIARTAYLDCHHILSYYLGWNFSIFPDVVHSFANFWSLARNYTPVPVGDSIKSWLPRYAHSQDTYMAATGDSGPGCLHLVTEVLTSNRTTCSGGAWIAPACRQNINLCVPVLTTGGRLVGELHQWAFFFDMPLAILEVDPFDWEAIPHEASVGFMWWTPDFVFSDLRPTMITFPDKNRAEWNNGVFKTGNSRIVLQKYAWSLMGSADGGRGSNIIRFLDKMTLRPYDFDDIFARAKLSGEKSYGQDEDGHTYYNATCAFLRANRGRWQDWVQEFDMCLPGSGTSPVNGTCEVCPAGFLSTLLISLNGSVKTRLCSACTAGTYCPRGAISAIPCPSGTFCLAQSAEPTPCPAGFEQPMSAQTFCIPCVGGTEAAERGTVTCAPCRPGRYSLDSPSTNGTRRAPGPTSCQPCNAGYFANARQQTRCKQCPAGMTTFLLAAERVSDCFCATGSFLLQSARECRTCPKGVTCATDVGTLAANRRLKISLLPGYFTDRFHRQLVNITTSAGDSFQEMAYKEPVIYRCRVRLHCPGGMAGTCAEGSKGMVCAACKKGYTANFDNLCAKCEQNDYLIAPSVFISSLIASLVFHLVANARPANSSSTTLLAISMCGMFCSCIQVLAIFPQMPIAWGSPVAEMLHATHIFEFSPDVFRLGCLFPSTPMQHYVISVALVPIAILYILMAFMIIRRIANVCKLQGSLKGFPSLFNSVGVIFLTFFISIARVGSLPFQYYDHATPNLQSVEQYPSVINGSAEHMRMCAIGATGFVCFPLAFLSHTVWCCSVYKKKVMQANIGFLRSTRYLFQRFRGHWYPCFILVRGLVLVLATIVSDVATKIMIILLVISFGVIVTAWYQPWAIKEANVADAILSTWLLIFVGCTNLQADINNTAMAQTLMLASLSAISLVALIVWIGVVIVKIRLRRRKPYSVFLCHHKLGSAACARMLKSSLTSHSKVKGVFLDSDNLFDLSVLFEVVRSQIDLHVVLMTRQILTRPWCVGEITVAHLNDVPILPVVFPCWTVPSHSFINGIHSILGEGGCEIIRSGMNFEHVRTMLLHVAHLSLQKDTALRLSATPTLDSMTDVMVALCRKCLKDQVGRASISGCYLGSDVAGGAEAEPADYIVIASDTCYESLATFRDLAWRMLRHFDGTKRVATVLTVRNAQKRRLCIESARAVVLLCTYQALDDMKVLSSVVFAYEASIPILPIISSQHFEFPSSESCNALSKRFASCLRHPHSTLDLGPAIQTAFQRIAVNMDMHQSETHLENATVLLVRRLRTISTTGAQKFNEVRSPVASHITNHRTVKVSIDDSPASFVSSSSIGRTHPDPFSDTNYSAQSTPVSGAPMYKMLSTKIARTIFPGDDDSGDDDSVTDDDNHEEGDSCAIEAFASDGPKEDQSVQSESTLSLSSILAV